MKSTTRNRGQASTEYLVILAIAIIIAVVVVSLLGGFIKIGGTTSDKTSKTYWKSADIALPSWSVVDGETSTFIVQNNLEYKINLDVINATNAGGTSYTTSIQKVLTPGQTYELTAPLINCSSTGGGSGSGSGYSFTIYFRYDNLDFGLNNKEFACSQKLTGNCES